MKTLFLSENKLRNATTGAQKEKYEKDVKTQVKKLQKIRDFIKSLNTDKDVKEKQKLLDVRREIEFVMENFRDHERDCKTKGYKFKTLMPANYFDEYDDDDEASESLSAAGLTFGNQSDEFEEDELEDVERLEKDRKFLNDFLNVAFTPYISKTETELETLKNKKPKTGSKKQKV